MNKTIIIYILIFTCFFCSNPNNFYCSRKNETFLKNFYKIYINNKSTKYVWRDEDSRLLKTNLKYLSSLYISDLNNIEDKNEFKLKIGLSIRNFNKFILNIDFSSMTKNTLKKNYNILNEISSFYSNMNQIFPMMKYYELSDEITERLEVANKIIIDLKKYCKKDFFNFIKYKDDIVDISSIYDSTLERLKLMNGKIVQYTEYYKNRTIQKKKLLENIYFFKARIENSSNIELLCSKFLLLRTLNSKDYTKGRKEIIIKYQKMISIFENIYEEMQKLTKILNRSYKEKNKQKVY